MGLRENLKNEEVRDLPMREAVIVRPDMKVRDAIEKMREKRLGCVIVNNDEQEPIGTFSESSLIDLLLKEPNAIDADEVQHHLDESQVPEKRVMSEIGG